ncbi:MAG: shikimate kinase [Gemmatimonadaceae bacterium]
MGLPGSGKSTVGAAVAERLGRSFLDFDKEIERREGATIATLFAEQGEHHFRSKERELTEELRAFGNMILAPGGGWVANADVVALLRPPASIIYLKVRPKVALERLGPAWSTRPLLGRVDPLAELERLLAEREPLYAAADHIMEADRLDLQQVTDKVTELASAGGRG